jgi:transposase InsO family protein
VPTGEGLLYLSTVLNAWSRRVVGWAMSETLRTALFVEALKMAVWNRRPAGEVVHHSDRGDAVHEPGVQPWWREAGLAPSMGSVGDA